MKIGDRLPEAEGELFLHQKVSKHSLQHARVCINAFLNTSGGRIVFGATEDRHILGVPLSQTEKDDVRLAVDSYLNAFIPQQDNDVVQTAFTELESAKGKQLFLVTVTVLPSTDCVVFTSTARAEAFYFNKYPIQLSADNIINRHTFPREQCVQCEHNKVKINQQQSILTSAMDFLKVSKKPTRIIVIDGPKNSGKSHIAKEIFQQLVFADRFSIDFKNYKYLNDIYLELIQQANNELKMKFKVISQEIQPIQAAAAVAPSPDDFFSQPFVVETPTRCPVLRNILFNETGGRKCCYLFDSVNTFVDDLINKGSQSTYVIACEDAFQLKLQREVAVDLIVLHTEELNPASLAMIFNSTNKTQTTAKEIENLMDVLRDDVNKVFYYLQTGMLELQDEVRLTEEQKLAMEQICLVPGKMSLKFIQKQLGQDFQTKLSQINMLLRKSNGYYALQSDLRTKLIAGLSETRRAELSAQLIDFVAIEIEELNRKHLFQFSKGKKPENFSIQAKIDAIEANEFFVNNLILIQEAMKLSVERRYKCAPLLADLEVFLINRAPLQMAETIAQMRKIAQQSVVVTLE